MNQLKLPHLLTTAPALRENPALRRQDFLTWGCSPPGMSPSTFQPGRRLTWEGHSPAKATEWPLLPTLYCLPDSIRTAPALQGRPAPPSVIPNHSPKPPSVESSLSAPLSLAQHWANAGYTPASPRRL